jgi:hypothetical protein
MALRTVSTSELRRELARREAGVSRLEARRDKLARKLAALDAELAGFGVAAGARRGPKPGRPKGRRAGRSSHGGLTLLGAILKGVRVGSTVSPAEAAIAARKAGYKSSSKHFGMMVANTLAKASEFKKLGRGQYQLKSGASAPVSRGRPAKRARRKGGKAKARKLAPRKIKVQKSRASKVKGTSATAVRPTPATTSGSVAAAAG